MANKPWYIKIAERFGLIAKTPQMQTEAPAKSLAKAQAVKKVGLAFVTSPGSRTFEEPMFDLDEITRAYNSEAYVRQAIDKYVDLIFKEGWILTGKNPQAVEYLRLRLEMMSIATSTPIEQFFVEVAEDLVRYANVFIIKTRLKTPLPGIAATGVDGKAPNAGYFLLNPTTITISRNPNGEVTKYKQTVTGHTPKEYNPEDIIHIYYKKDRGRAFGVPFLVPVLEDIRALRDAEENVLRLIYKHIFPLYVYQVGLPEPGFEATDEEIESLREQISQMSLDGGLVVPERHNIKAVGAEGSALRAEKYLEYFERRVFSGLGVSEVQFGRGDCYDEKTQTLTNDGWKYYYEVKDGDLIATFNPDTKRIEYHAPVDGYTSHIYHYNGDMYCFKSKHIDIKVSPDHEMWITTDRKKWHKVKAKDLYENGPKEFVMLEGTDGFHTQEETLEINIPTVDYDKNAHEHGIVCTFPAVDFAKLIGYYISKGSIYNGSDNRYSICLSQNDNQVFVEMTNTLDKLGIKYNVRTDQRDNKCKTISFYHKSLHAYLLSEVGLLCSNKRIPRSLLDSSPSVLQAMFDALIDGDGTVDKRIGRTNKTYYTTNQGLADDVQELAIRLGYKAKNIYTKQPRGSFSPNGYIYRILLNIGKNPWRHFKKENISKVPYDGIMYCYNVPNHLFVTRRNGKVTIQGNTANRSTSDAMTTEMHDRVKAFQRAISIFIDKFIIDEVLLEGGFDRFARPEDDVNFSFNEIELESKIKAETHAIYQYEHNAISELEMRKQLGLDPIPEAERVAMHLAVVTIPKLDAKGTPDEPASTPAETNNKQKPTNQHGTRTGPKKARESVSQLTMSNSTLSGQYKSMLDYHWELTKEDIIALIKQYYSAIDPYTGEPFRSLANFSGQEMQTILHLTKESMYGIAQKYNRASFFSGVEEARTQTAWQTLPNVSYRRYLIRLEDDNKRTITRLMNDLTSLIVKSVKSAKQEEIVSKVVGCFQALAFRLDFISNTEVMKAYNHGFAVSAIALDRKDVQVVFADKEVCNKCKSLPTDINLEGDFYSKVPPFHPNCQCTIKISQ